MTITELTEDILNYAIKNKIKKIYICGNGTAGKTTLSKSIKENGEKYGNINLISLDDFMVDIELRKNTNVSWNENGIQYDGRYTSSNKESYFLKNVYEILYNLDHGLDCYYFPMRYKEKNNMRKMYSNNFLTVLEGVGTVFLDIDKEESLTIFLKCSKEDEINRRIKRTENLNRNQLELYDEKRASQFRANILPEAEKFDLIIESNQNFEYSIIKDSTLSNK